MPSPSRPASVGMVTSANQELRELIDEAERDAREAIMAEHNDALERDKQILAELRALVIAAALALLVAVVALARTM